MTGETSIMERRDGNGRFLKGVHSYRDPKHSRKNTAREYLL